VSTRPLVQVVFGLLVIATVGAFIVSQRLKSEEPVVIRFARAPKSFSPDGDGVRDRVRVGFDLGKPATVTFSVIDAGGEEVRRIVDERRLAGDEKHRFVWDGRDSFGRVVPDGIYRMRVVRGDGRTLDSVKRIRVSTRRARPGRLPS
jgi:hypothetical protein